jgi:hypothetical protein
MLEIADHELVCFIIPLRFDFVPGGYRANLLPEGPRFDLLVSVRLDRRRAGAYLDLFVALRSLLIGVQYANDKGSRDTLPLVSTITSRRDGH